MGLEFLSAGGERFFPVYTADPAETGLSLVDLHIASPSRTVGNVLQPHGAERLQIFTETIITGAAPSLGTYYLELELLDDEGNIVSAPADPAIALLTSTSSAGTYWGSFVLKVGSGPAIKGNLSPGAWTDPQDYLMLLKNIRLAINVPTQAYNSGTSTTVSVYAWWA